MALVYFDTSALVKLLVADAGTEAAVALWDGADAVVTSRLAQVDVPALLGRGWRTDVLTATTRQRAEALWATYLPALRLVEVAPVAEAAAQLAIDHPLRAAESIHLASALALREGGAVMASWDARLATAARAEGLSVVPIASMA